MKEQAGNQPLISVIVPVYNGEKYLRACIESIQNQTWKNIETLVINDGSTDETAKVLAQLEQEFSNIVSLKLEDKGVSAARNLGLNSATGEYITFVDADDIIASQMIEKLYHNLIKHDADISGCGFFTWKNKEELDSGITDFKKEFRCSGYPSQLYLEEEILKGNSRCWSKLYKRSTIGAVRFRENISIGEDMLFLVDLLPHVKRIAESDVRGYGYFQNSKGAMNRPFTSKYMDQITCWELMREVTLRENESESINLNVTSKIVVSIMLTVGKLAMLSVKERKTKHNYLKTCYDKLKHEMKVKGISKTLSLSYRIKVYIFIIFPKAYIALYHFKKCRTKENIVE